MNQNRSQLDIVLENTCQTAPTVCTDTHDNSDSKLWFHSPYINDFLNAENDVDDFAAWIQLFNLQNTVAPENITRENIVNLISRQLSSIDERISNQLNIILHHPKLQRLEASWLGVWRLIDASSHYNNIKVRVLNVSWKEVGKDISRASDFDQSMLFQLIYNEEFGVPGGEPYGVLLGDYEISHKPFDGHPYDDVSTLRGLAEVAAASFAPFICSAAPQLFGLDSFDTLGNPIHFEQIFKHPQYIQWNSLREREDARFIGICLPKVLMRKPHQPRLGNYKGLIFKESCGNSDSSDYLWGNGCYAIGTILIREFGDVGWFAHIRGVPRDYYGGGLLTAFTAPDCLTDSADTAYKIVTQAVVSDKAERQLSDLGFIPICQCYDTPFAAIQSCASLQKPKQYQSKDVTANARISAMLQQVFCASRFAHYIKVMMRDKVGSFTSEYECEKLLQNWFSKYCTSRDDLEWDMLARYPLRSARVKVRELPGKPGHYTSIIHLQPHYIVDHLVSELRLTTELAMSGIGTAR